MKSPVLRHGYSYLTPHRKGVPSKGITWAVWLRIYPLQFGYSYFADTPLNPNRPDGCDAGVVDFHITPPYVTLRRGTVTTPHTLREAARVVRGAIWPALCLVLGV